MQPDTALRSRSCPANSSQPETVHPLLLQWAELRAAEKPQHKLKLRSGLLDGGQAAGLRATLRLGYCCQITAGRSHMQGAASKMALYVCAYCILIKATGDINYNIYHSLYHVPPKWPLSKALQFWFSSPPLLTPLCVPPCPDLLELAVLPRVSPR